jgi:hypothetical protein
LSQVERRHLPIQVRAAGGEQGAEVVRVEAFDQAAAQQLLARLAQALQAAGEQHAQGCGMCWVTWLA